MKPFYSIFALAFLFFTSTTQATITLGTISGRLTVTITGTETGGDLRTFILSNTTAGTVTDRDIVFFGRFKNSRHSNR